jgi:hypothetical protein
MLRTLSCGVFNSGFVAVRRSLKATHFLEWWNEKLHEYCYKDESTGLYCDQKWLDIGVSFFDVTVFREIGYNVANWNVASRHLSYAPVLGYRVNGRPLRFFHFSMINYDRDLYYFTKHLGSENPIFDMRARYIRRVAELDRGGHSRLPWTYDFYNSGERISADARLAYRDQLHFAANVPKPFGESNAAMSCIEAEFGHG